MESSQFLAARIARVERERSVALSKIEEYQAKAAAAEANVREIDVLLKHLRQWELEDVGGEAATLQDSIVPIRAMVKEFCREHLDFTSAELVAAIHTKNPSAREPSIRSELSHAKKRGDLTMIEKDHYHSQRYNGTGGTQNEPGDDFGKLVS